MKAGNLGMIALVGLGVWLLRRKGKEKEYPMDIQQAYDVYVTNGGALSIDDWLTAGMPEKWEIEALPKPVLEALPQLGTPEAPVMPVWSTAQIFVENSGPAWVLTQAEWEAAGYTGDRFKGTYSQWKDAF